MLLNWSQNVIMDFIFGFLFIFGAIIFKKGKNVPNIKTYFYLRLFWINNSLFLLLEGISLLFLSATLHLIFPFTLISILILLIFAANHSIKKTISILSLIPTIIIGTLMVYLSFQPGSITSGFEYYWGVPYPTFIWTGSYRILVYLLMTYMLFYFSYWFLKIWINAPFEIKRIAFILLASSFLEISGIILSFLIIIDPSFLFIANLLGILGISIITVILIKEPKLVFVLPFTPYGLIVKNKDNEKIFEYIWSKLNIKDINLSNIFSISYNNDLNDIEMVQTLEIKLKDGIIIIYKDELIAVGLIISKSSKLLKKLIEGFSREFQNKFRELLIEKENDPNKYRSADELLEKYFSVFPSRIIDDQKKPLFLAGEIYKLPPKIENKLKEIIKDEKEFEFVKCEFQRTGNEEIFSEFLSLYDELKAESESKDEKMYTK